MAGGVVVAAIEHHAGAGQETIEQGRIGPGLHGLHMHMWVERLHGLRGRADLGLANACGAVGNLALQVGEVNHIIIDQRQLAHTCSAQ